MRRNLTGRIEDDSARFSIMRLQPMTTGLGNIKSVRIRIDSAAPQFIPKLDLLKGELSRRDQGKSEVQLVLSLPDGRDILTQISSRNPLRGGARVVCRRPSLFQYQFC
jgi:hypothetical protein